MNQARTRTLSLTLAVIGVIAAATPASAANGFKTRVEVTGVVQDEACTYSVKGRVHSPDRRCRKRPVSLRRTEGVENTHLSDHPTRQDTFTITVPQSEGGNTFRVRVVNGPSGEHGDEFDPGFHCKADESRQFTLTPPS